jgi:MFS family permease
MRHIGPTTSRSPRFHYAWVVLGVGTLVVFGSLGLARFGYTMLLPAMQAALGLDNTQAGALATANLAGYVLLSLAGGALAARYGPRAVIAVGLAVVAGGMLLTGLTGSFAGAAGWRALTGIGSGASNVPVMGLLAAWFVPRRRGLAAGVGVTGSSLALILLGPLVPRVLAAHGQQGWRVCWFLFAGAVLALGVVALAALRNRPGDVGLRPLGEAGDEGGTGPSGPGAEEHAEQAPPLNEEDSPGAAGVPLSASPRPRIPASRRTATQGGPRVSASPPPSVPAAATWGGLHWGSIYRSSVVWHVGAVYAAFGFSYIIYLTFFVKYLTAQGGYTAKEAGGLFMTMGWVSLLCGVIWGWVSDLIGRKGALVIVYLLHAVAFGLFALWPTPVGFTVSAVLFGLSAWSIPAIMAATCGDLLGPRLSPAGLGFVTLFFGLGQAAGPYTAGALADATKSFAPAMLLAAGVALLGAGGAALLGNVGVRRA